MAGDIPDYLQQPVPAVRRPQPPRHKVVQAPIERPARALVPPRNTPLRPRDREQYADNAPPVWVRGGSNAEDDQRVARSWHPGMTTAPDGPTAAGQESVMWSKPLGIGVGS